MSNNITIFFEFASENTKQHYNDKIIPSTKYSAGIDLKFCGVDMSKFGVLQASFENDILSIQPYERVLINTGLKCFIPTGYVLKLYARSSLALKQGLTLSNCVGIVDADYADEIKVILHNTSKQVQSVKIGDRVCQAILEPVVNFCFEKKIDNNILSLHNERNALVQDSATIRHGGFGSTGI